MILEQSVCEDLWRGKPKAPLAVTCDGDQCAYGSSAIDAAQSWICSKCASRSAMTDIRRAVCGIMLDCAGRKQTRDRRGSNLFRTGVSPVKLWSSRRLTTTSTPRPHLNDPLRLHISFLFSHIFKGHSSAHHGG